MYDYRNIVIVIVDAEEQQTSIQDEYDVGINKEGGDPPLVIAGQSRFNVEEE